MKGTPNSVDFADREGGVKNVKYFVDVMYGRSLAAARRRGELEGGDEAVGGEAVVVERHLAAGAAATLFDAVVEVPRVRHHGRVGVHL